MIYGRSRDAKVVEWVRLEDKVSHFYEGGVWEGSMPPPETF